jgi:hypothetical protein
MTIFAVLLPIPQPLLSEKIRAEFPNDSLQLNDYQWLISATGTVIELTAKLGIVNKESPEAPTGVAVIFSTSSYYGRAPSPTWDWIKSKLESGASNG